MCRSQAVQEMRVWSLAFGVQAQVANHRKRCEPKAQVVSDTEKAPCNKITQVSGESQGRRTPVNRRERVESPKWHQNRTDIGVRDESGGNLLTVQMMSGIKAA